MTDSKQNGSEGGSGPAPTARPSTPVPLALSIAAGAVGVVLMVLGILTDNNPLRIIAVVAGALSLGTALYWRSMLVAAWGAQKRGQPPRR